MCRRVHSPYAYVAKVFCQKALALAAVDDLAGACRAYEDALMEDRSRPIEKKLKKMEKIMKQKAKAAYLRSLFFILLYDRILNNLNAIIK